jgi:hypothetical protein
MFGWRGQGVILHMGQRIRWWCGRTFEHSDRVSAFAASRREPMPTADHSVRSQGDPDSSICPTCLNVVRHPITDASLMLGDREIKATLVEFRCPSCGGRVPVREDQ